MGLDNTLVEFLQVEKMTTFVLSTVHHEELPRIDPTETLPFLI